MTFVSYAQNFEDVLLRRALHDVERGQYLDIGAQDPVIDSVSLAFYERGWRGIHVEPTPAFAARLREARPDETVLEVAVATTAGPMEFYEIPETGLSTGKKEIAERHSESGFEKRKIVVPCMRLDDLLASVTGDLHWMKVDVEGMEAEVLKSWGDNPLRPWVLLIEATFPNSQEHCEHLWMDEVRGRGYWEVHFDGLSRYFVHEDHKELADRFGTPPNLFDGFHVTSTHFSAGTLNENFGVELAQVRDQAKESETQLRQELASMGQALETASVAAREAQSERLAMAEALAASEREHRGAIELMWRERNDLEARLRDRGLEIERRLRDQLSFAEVQMRQDGADLAALRERSAQQQERIEQIRQDAEAARRQIVGLDDQISTIRASAREEQKLAAAQIDERNQQLAQASQVIGRALAEPIGSWQRLGRALALFREDGARRQLRSWYSHLSQPSNLNVETIMSVPSGEARNPYLRANSLPELLAWDDENFVRCAYVTILGRQPDVVGEAYYTARVRGGRSKKEILWQLRKSSEGRRHDPGIAGLDRALKAARWQRLKPFGRSPAGRAMQNIAVAPESSAIFLRIEQRFSAVEDKLDRMQRSLSLLEGEALQRVEVKPEINSKLNGELFRKNLALVASKIERD